jgi:hypothetical protein
MRLVRSVAAALVCVIAAALGHVSAGGAMPGLAVVAVFAGSALVAWMLSARRITGGQLTGLLVLCQAGVHLAAPHDQMTMNASMIAAHVLATAISAVVLTRGERFAWHLAERLGLRLAPLRRVVALPPTVRPQLAVVAIRALHDVRLAHSHWLRGPPVGPA